MASDVVSRPRKVADTAATLVGHVDSAAALAAELKLGEQARLLVTLSGAGTAVKQVDHLGSTFEAAVQATKAAEPVVHAVRGGSDGVQAVEYLMKVQGTGSPLVRGLGAASRKISVVGHAVGAAQSMNDQWKQDAERPDVGEGRRWRRASYRGGVSTGAAITGGTAGRSFGAWVGGAIGTVLLPGIGTPIGAAIGGLIGGIGGSKAACALADQVVDRTVDHIG